MVVDSLRSSAIMSKNSLTGLALGLLCKEAVRSIEQMQIGDYAGDEDDAQVTIEGDLGTPVEEVKDTEPLVAKKKKKAATNTPPAPMYKQVIITLGTLSLGVGSQQIFVIKASLRFFHNILRQCAFSKSVPIIAGATVACLASGSYLNLSDDYSSLGKCLFSIGQGLPFGELKAWQLGRKIPAQ